MANETKEDALLRPKDVYPKEEKVDTWPYLVGKELIAILIFSIVLVVWGLLRKAGGIPKPL